MCTILERAEDALAQNEWMRTIKIHWKTTFIRRMAVNRIIETALWNVELVMNLVR